MITTKKMITFKVWCKEASISWKFREATIQTQQLKILEGVKIKELE